MIESISTYNKAENDIYIKDTSAIPGLKDIEKHQLPIKEIQDKIKELDKQNDINGLVDYILSLQDNLPELKDLSKPKDIKIGYTQKDLFTKETTFIEGSIEGDDGGIFVGPEKQRESLTYSYYGVIETNTGSYIYRILLYNRDNHGRVVNKLIPYLANTTIWKKEEILNKKGKSTGESRIIKIDPNYNADYTKIQIDSNTTIELNDDINIVVTRINQ